MKKGIWLATTALAVSFIGAPAGMAIVISPDPSINDLAQSLAGTGVTIHNPTYTGNSGAIGSFNNGFASGLGINNGVILATGNINNALGPNNSTSLGSSFGLPGDGDLDALLDASVTEDAAVLEFDFETSSGNIFLNFIFATEEFPEYVGNIYNDAFGFFVDGQNIALIPNTILPITLNNLGASGFINNSSGSLDVQYDGVTNAFTAQLLGLAAGLHTFKLVIADVGDDAYDSAVFLQAGSLASVEVPTGESEEPVATVLGVRVAPKEIVVFDIGAVASAVGYGLPMALIQRSLVESATRTITRDVGGRLFKLRSMPLAPPSNPDQRFSYFASGDFGFIDRNQTDTLTGFNSNSRSGTNGFEYRFSEHLTIGLAGGYVDTDGDVAEELGSATIKGFAASPYFTYTNPPIYLDVLYSFSNYEHELRRRTGLGRTARAEPESQNHFIQMNAGYNIQAGKLVHGPTLTVDYLRGELDEYTETGGANANIHFEAQEYDSLITRIGWQASYRVDFGIVSLIPQVRASWDRENLDDPDEATGYLVTSPTTIITASGSRKGENFDVNGSQERPDTDYLSIGAALRVSIGKALGFIIDYEGQFLREDETAHFASIKFDVPF